MHRIQRLLLPGFLFVFDILTLAFAAWLAMIVRFPNEPAQYAFYTPSFSMNVPVMVACYMLFYTIFQLHRRVWQYAGPREIWHIALANLGGFFLFICYAQLMALNLPRSIYVITGLLATMLVIFSRLTLRYIYFRINAEERRGDEKQVLIVGAGDAGHLLMLDIQQRDKRQIVGFIYDDPRKKGHLLNGIRILGGREVLVDAVAKYGVEEIIIAIPSLPAKELQQLADLCHKTKCDIKVIPSFFSSLDNVSIKVKDLRPLSIEDLLNRDPVQMDVKAIGSYLTDKVVLITGAGGSIGSELCRQVLKMHPKRLVMVGRGENSIYEINQELLQRHAKELLLPFILNVENKAAMEQLFQLVHPQVVFHAAAHKHVPMMEAQPREAIENNIRGSWNVADLACKYQVERFVLISTDKAVNPTSVMGATKRVTEMIMQAINKRCPSTKFMAVRFGNVLGSRGSVVPLFKKQIEAGGPVTVTDPEMKRYFMTIPEASQLVLQAGAMGQGGEVFVLDMGEPVKIVDLARNMIQLSGLEPDRDIEIKFTGLRPGEKLFEELLTAEEGTIATRNSKIFQAILKDQDPKVLGPQLNELLACTDTDDCIKHLQEILPTYHPNHF